MARITPFSVGQRWYVDRGATMNYAKPNFWFVIVGPGDKPNEKLCRVEVDVAPFKDNPSMVGIALKSNNLMSIYTHAHLKKYAVLSTSTPEAFEVSQKVCEDLMERLAPLRDAERACRAGEDLRGAQRYWSILQAVVREQPLSVEDQAVLDALVEKQTLSTVFTGDVTVRKTLNHG